MLSFEPVAGVAAARRFVEAVDIITLAESHGGIETLRGRNQPVQVISSRHQYGKGFRYTQKIDRLDMHRMAQSLEGGAAHQNGDAVAVGIGFSVVDPLRPEARM
jgi:hypothetical protein